MTTQALPLRIQTLKDELFAVKTRTCYERAVLLCRSYKETEGEPMPLRRAKAFNAILTEMSIYIRPGELLVGGRCSKPGWKSSYPEYSLTGPWSGEHWPAEVTAYFAGNTIADANDRLYSERAKLTQAEQCTSFITGAGTGFGHVIADYEKAIKTGLRAVIEECEREKARCGDRRERDYLDACILSCEAVIAWANRYADLAVELAGRETDAVRRRELLEIADACRRVPEHPARTLREALQAFVLVHYALHIEQMGWSISAGRFDQYMYPYYQADLAAGRLDRDGALELVLSVWLKLMENVDRGLRITIHQNLTLGGQDVDGNDAANEFSHICLDATARSRFNQPALSVRWHPRIDPGFWNHVMEVIATGVGMPALFNDDVIYPALRHNGVREEDIWNYGIVGCVEPAIPGKMQGVTAGGHLNIAKALELALTGGVSLTTGKVLGPSTGDAADFADFESFFAAYETQVKSLAAIAMDGANSTGNVHKQLGHCPFISSLLDGCIRRRRDMVEGGAVYSLSGVAVFGATNAVDGIMAVKKLVYEQGRYTMAQLLAALRADYHGYEDIRRQFLGQRWRFGNDIDEVDALANSVYKVHADFCALHPDARGGHFTCGIWPVDGHVGAGRHTGALPDGRHLGEPLVDGVGACQGCDRGGPTALLKSVSKLNSVEHWAAGNTCNIKFSRTSIQSPKGLQSMGQLAEVFLELGGQELQINVVDAQTLRDAQEHPHRYADLLVRVAGYSGYFTLLSKESQDEVISRTEQSAV